MPLLLGLCLWLAAPARAQFVEPDATSMLSVTGTQNGDLFGWLVQGVGDVDGDGVADFAVTSPFFDSGGKSSAGKVSVHSGRNGAELWHQTTTLTSAILGFSLATIGDVDGDGAREVVSGAPFNASSGGNAFVYSGRTGAVIKMFLPEASGDSLGHSVAAGGDFDGDGIEDLAIAAIGVTSTAADGGRVYVYSTAGFGLIATIDPPVATEREFGGGLAFLGDINHDGRDELVICSRDGLDSPTGSLHVYSYIGTTPSLDYTVEPVGMGGPLDGDRVDAGRDVDGDGSPDIFVGDLAGDTASVYAGKNGALIHELTGISGTTFGSGGLTGDLDGDGEDDLLVGARLNDSGAVNGGKLFVISGRNASVIRTFTSTKANSSFGADASVLGDLNGDGSVEFVVGASGSATGGKSKVFVMSGKPCPASWSNYGAGYPGTGGIPPLTASANPQIGSAITVDAGNSRGANTVGVLVFGTSQASIGGSWGGTLLVLPAFVLPVTIPAAGLSLPATVPLDTTLCGLALYAQVLEQDPGASRGVSATPGLALVLGS